jgi:hypothetical protein
MPMLNRIILALAFLATPALAADRPLQPAQKTDPACEWQWLEGQGVGLWAERCKLVTGDWHLVWEHEMPGFSLWVDDKRQGMVMQLFTLPKEAGINALLPELRSRALIADTDDCVFKPAAVRPAPRTIQQFDIQPVGEALKRFEATPKDEVPEPPCGDYAWSTHGTRYFQTDLRHPGKVVYIDEGQDGTFFDPRTMG